MSKELNEREKRIFVLDTKAGESILAGIFRQLEKKNIKSKLQLGKYFGEIPKDYDIYFLHLHDLDEEELRELKKTQPESYFIEIGVGGGYFKGERRIRDSPGIFTSKDISNILERAYNK